MRAVYMIVYSNMAAVTKFIFVVCHEPAIEINWLIDLKFIGNKMITIYFSISFRWAKY